jgi:hypothetical protein
MMTTFHYGKLCLCSSVAKFNIQQTPVLDAEVPKYYETMLKCHAEEDILAKYKTMLTMQILPS